MYTKFVICGQILRRRQEQLESDRNAPPGYTLIWCSVGHTSWLHLSHIFLLGATSVKIQTHSPYLRIYQEFPFPPNPLISFTKSKTNQEHLQHVSSITTTLQSCDSISTLAFYCIVHFIAISSFTHLVLYNSYAVVFKLSIAIILL